MSYTILHALHEDGAFTIAKEYQNSHLFAMYIWGHMAKQYLGLDQVPIGDKPAMRRLWDLTKRDDVPDAERIALATTFDYVLVRQADLSRVVDAYHAFEDHYGGDSHLPQMRQDLLALRTTPSVVAVCWTQTSIVGNMWKVYEPPPIDEYRDYDMARDDKHWFLFSEADR